MKRGGTEEVVKKGVLEKVNKIGFNSKKLCVLSKTEFHYADQKAHGSVKHIPLQDIQAVKRDHSSKGFVFEIIGKSKTEIFAAESLDTCELWLKAIQSTLLTNRRISVTSTSSTCSDAPKSPVSHYVGHGYEEINIEETGQPVFTSNEKSPVSKTPVGHAYETVDMDTEEKPKISRHTRGLCTTVDALKGPPGTMPPNTPALPPLSISPVGSSEPPVYSEPVKMQKPCAKDVKPPISPKPAVSRKPAVSPKPTASPKPSNNKSQTFEFENYPDTSGLCMTVDALGGPPKAILGNSGTCSTQNESPEEGLYSEALTDKRSDLYVESKKLHAERMGQKTKGSKGSELCTEEYSSAYSTASQPDTDQYSCRETVETRDEVKTRSGVYSLAKPLPSAMSPIPEPPSTGAADDSAVYSDAASCPSKVEKKSAKSPKINNKSHPRSAGTNFSDNPNNGSSNPVLSLGFGTVERSDAISKLDQFLSNCGKLSPDKLPPSNDAG